MAKKLTLVVEIKDKASAGVKKLQQGVSALSKPFSLATSGAKGLFKGLTSIQGILTAGAAGGLIKASLSAAGRMEQWGIAFNTLTGSAAEADKLLKEITTFAAKTPFELTGLVENSKKLLAFGVATEDIIPTMKSLGDIAAGVGTDKLPSLVNAFGKIRTKGTASMEELNIMLEAGVPILDELAKGFGVTTKEVVKMVSKGQVGFEDVDKSLKTLTTGNGKFADLMEKQSKSFNGILSNIKDNVTQGAIAIGQEMLPAAKRIAEGIREFTKTDHIIEWIGFIKKAFFTLERDTKITAEILKSLISAPFSWETYKVLFDEFTERLGGFWKAVKGGWRSLQEFREGLRKEEQENELSLTERIENIRADHSEKLKQIDEDLSEKLKKVNEDTTDSIVETTKSGFEDIVNASQMANDELVGDLRDLKAEGKSTFRDVRTNATDQIKDIGDSTEDLGNIWKDVMKGMEFAADTMSGPVNFIIDQIMDNARTALLLLDELTFGADIEKRVRRERERFEKRLVKVEEEIQEQRAGLEDTTDERERERISGRIAGLQKRRTEMIESRIDDLGINLEDAAAASQVRFSDILDPVGSAKRIGDANTESALLNEELQQLKESLRQNKFRNGGIVPGTSSRGDRVPIMANSGEMVLNHEQQSKLFNAIGNMNNDMGRQQIVVNFNGPLLGDRRQAQQFAKWLDDEFITLQRTRQRVST